MPNRLAHETSPYLLQHADNPVDWYPWGEEAFARARAEDKPVLVSIGYAACHWCHVMERESFEDPDVALVMNHHFVCVKVDREERPDVDAIYMDAVQAMTGSGGWPLNAFLTPDGVPFFAGTYFPPEPRQGRPSWKELLAGVHNAWTSRREEIEEAARTNIPRLQGARFLEAPPETEIVPELLDTAVASLRRAFDAENGGWGGAPKFPAAPVIEFLLARDERAMPLQTLRRMASGGIYDQVGGGFARYAVDPSWVVPHFEKMLYDNALLARAYLHAYQVTGEPLFRRVCEETLDWAMRELRQDEGGFASSLDADSEGVEGKFYVWTPDQIRAAIPDLADVAIRHFGVTDAGNFEGANVLVRATSDPPELAEIKAGLLAARAERVRPALDDKRLTSWNALMIAALADAGAALERADYVAAAVACARFIESELVADGRLLRTFNRGRAKLPGFLEDHAYLLEAYLVLYEATFDDRWFVRARELADVILERFLDPERGGFFSVADDHTGLIARRKDLEDAPIPSGGSAATFGLLRLARLTGEARYEDAALSLIRLVHKIVPEHPLAFGHLLRAIDFYLAPVREVALAGRDVSALARVVRGAYRPHVVLAGGGSEQVPLLAGRTPVDGQPAAYVCEHFACRLPVTDPGELERALAGP